MNMNAHRKMTPKGQMSNSGMGPAISHLPMHLKALFEPNAPLEYKPKIVKRKMPPYEGVGAFSNLVRPLASDTMLSVRPITDVF